MRARRWLLAIVAIAVGVLGLLVPASPASAHASLESSAPTAGAVLEESPPRVELVFDESVELGGLRGIQLFASSGDEVPLSDIGQPSRDRVSAALPSLDDDLYAVVWEVVSADGHPARGAFTFQVGTDVAVDGDQLVADVLAGREGDAAVGWLLGLSRFAAFVGVVILIGGVVLICVARPAAFELRRSRAILWVGWWWLLAGTLGWFLLQGPYVTRGSLGDVVDPDLWGDVAGTRLGRLLLVRLGLVVIAGVLLAWHRASVSTVWRSLALLLGLGLVLTYSTSGHPSVEAPVAYGVALDAVHLAAVSVWIGGLVMLLGGGRSWFADPVVDHGEPIEPHPVRRFSRWALVAVVLIVATGIAQTVHLAGGLGDLTETHWGRLLLIKVALVVVLVTLGAVSRWLLHHEGPTHLRRGIVTEAVIAVVVIAVTAALVGTPPTSESSAGSFSATLVQSGVIADVTVSPARTGTNELHLVFTTPGGTLQAVQGAEARMLLPARDLPAVDIELSALGPNHWTGIVQLPFEGDWTLEVIVRPDATQQVLLSTVVPVGS